jgi:hypothetical protein
MRRISVFLLATLVAGGCATFKELEPEPRLSPAERGYVELKNDKEDFELEKDSKYFIRFPSPPSPNVVLVLVTTAKPSFHSFLTARFDDEKTPGAPIPDENAASDSILVYAAPNTVPVSFWIIDSVSRDLILHIRYRYVPQWRYTFENRYADLNRLLADNTVDRFTYAAIDPQFDLERVDISAELVRVEERLARVGSMRDELLRLEKIFPANIAASGDTAYQQYLALKKRTDDEVTFQENYAAVLNFFKKEKATHGNTGAFLEAAPYFTDLLSQRDRFPQGVRGKAVALVAGRLPELAAFLDDRIRAKQDIDPIQPSPGVEVLDALYRSCDRQLPPAVESSLRFISRFNEEVEALAKARAGEQALASALTSRTAPGNEAFYAGLAARAREVKSLILESRTGQMERYAGVPCALMLAREIQRASDRAEDFVAMYQAATAAAGGMETGMWGRAETGVRDLYESRSLSGAADIAAQRLALVGDLEDRLFAAVRTSSEQRIDAFIKAHEMEIDNVPALYADSAFLPVYTLTFSAQGQPAVARKRKQIESYLDQIKYNQLPENSIKAIYAAFTSDMRERGVEKARAIVEHGKFYRGTDKQVKGLITECDVTAAKWVIRPKEYRKLFALPVTSNATGTNEYMFRIRLQIPTEAEFPVFDVNVKLPQEVADKAGQAQWYESITIDNKPLKNEGRFRITSPTAENNYETLITPVQMDKNGRHLLEVRFSYPGFRVFEVSAMAQVPIIRKN